MHRDREHEQPHRAGAAPAVRGVGVGEGAIQGEEERGAERERGADPQRRGGVRGALRLGSIERGEE